MPRSYKEGDKTIVVYTKNELASQPDRSDWERVDAMSDEEVTANALSDPDSTPTDSPWDPKFAMTISELLEKRRKRQVTLRLDPDILDWFKMQGKGYQTLMNEALKTFVQHQQPATLRPAPASSPNSPRGAKK